MAIVPKVQYVNRLDRVLDKVDRVLDKGIVIEDMESRTVVASIDTYLARGELIQFLTDRGVWSGVQRRGTLRVTKIVERSVPRNRSRGVPHSRRFSLSDRQQRRRNSSASSGSAA